MNANTFATGFNNTAYQLLLGLRNMYQQKPSRIELIESEIEDIQKAERNVPTVPVCLFQEKMKLFEQKNNVPLAQFIKVLYLTKEEMDELQTVASLESSQSDYIQTEARIMDAAVMKRNTPNLDIDAVRPLLIFADDDLISSRRKKFFQIEETYNIWNEPTKKWLLGMLFKLAAQCEAFIAYNGDKTVQAQLDKGVMQLQNFLSNK